MYDTVKTDKDWHYFYFFIRPTSPFSLPRMIGAPSVQTPARLDQLSFLSSKNADKVHSECAYL